METFINEKRDLEFPKGAINAPGMLGFSPEPKKEAWWGKLDAFVTNPISYRARKAARNRDVIEFSGGGLVHSGHPNKGMTKTIREYGGQWAKARIPIIVCLMEEDDKRLGTMVRQIEEVENILAIAVLIGEDYSKELTSHLLRTAQGELPLLAHISVERALEIGELCMDSGADAICVGPARGSLPNEEGAILQGRIYGASQFPRALFITRELARSGIPVVGGGGIFRADEGRAMLDAGALAVQLDTVLWKADWDEGDWNLRAS